MAKDDLGDRMKSYYEDVAKTRLMKRTPVIIRVDGKAFHTFTKRMDKPFDKVLSKTMQDTMKYMCENIQGCVLGYTQSDEITLVLVDYARLSTSAWFDYEVQKLCSISAAMATLAFNRSYAVNVAYLAEDDDDFKRYAANLNKALFDSRCFNVPKEEVANCLLWRQLDAEKNSISLLAQAYYSPKELMGKSGSEKLRMLEAEKGVRWEDLPKKYRIGSCCVRKLFYKLENGERTDYVGQCDGEQAEIGATLRREWVIDDDIPKFVGEGRLYVEDLIG